MEIKQETGEQPNISEKTFTDLFNQKTIDSLYKLIKGNTSNPTGVPKTFKDQFYFKTDGTVYVYIDGTWSVIGSGNMTQTSGTSLPSASANTDKYYYLTTTDTLYRSNGTSWIALN